MLGASFVLAACGADTDSDVPENRQFANDPVPTRVATEVPTPPPTANDREPESRSAAATPADLLRVRGAPSTLYTISNGKLYSLDVQDTQLALELIRLPSGMLAVDVAASPTGDRVGVALRNLATGSVEVRFFDHEGRAIGDPYDLVPGATPMATPFASPVATPIGTPGASPVAGIADGPVRISWEPQGNGILLVAGNTITAVDIEGGSERIDAGAIPGDVVSAASSPTGGQILAHAVTGDGDHRAYLIQRDTGEVDELFAVRSQAGDGLSEVAWLPTGNGIVFVRGELVDGTVTRGQLFVYRFRDEQPRLLATAGQGGPSATIRNVAVGPGGSSVAYEVAVYDIDHWSTHSMWIRSLKHDSAAMQLPVESGHTVTGVAWSDEGLVWRYTSTYGPEGDFVAVLGSDVVVQEVLRLSISPDASPVASPGAAPVTHASPPASPAATPQGSPQATPVE